MSILVVTHMNTAATRDIKAKYQSVSSHKMILFKLNLQSILTFIWYSSAIKRGKRVNISRDIDIRCHRKAHWKHYVW